VQFYSCIILLIKRNLAYKGVGKVAMNELLSVIIPTYKQEKTISQDIKRILQSLEQAQLKAEVLVVVDGKLDQSFQKVKKIKYPQVRVFQLEKNHGKGYAIRYGMARSKGSTIAFIDAGMEINPFGLKTLVTLQKSKGADIVIGSKRHPDSHVSYPTFRRILSFAYQLLVLFLFGLNVRDTQVGLKLFKRRVLEDVLPRLLVKRYAFDIEILSVAHHLGYRKIIEAPIDLNYNFTQLTTAASLQVISRMLTDTLAVFYRLKIRGYYNNGNQRKWVYDKDLDYKVNVG
jgi:glycosyltransferase involved in cell wall biosynthesis